MKKLTAIVTALLLILAMTVPTYAVTTGKWDFGAAEDHVQDTIKDIVEGKVIYDYNGGWVMVRTGWRYKVTTEAEYEVEDTHIIPETTPWRYNHTFAGWMAPDGMIYQPGDELEGIEKLTLVAQWEAK